MRICKQDGGYPRVSSYLRIITLAYRLRAKDIFAQAVESFYSTLPDADRASFQGCANPSTMLQQMSAACSRHQQSSRLYACCSKIARFSRAFEPFYEVVNIFVQVKPDIMALVWGSIRLIFQVSTILVVANE